MDDFDRGQAEKWGQQQPPNYYQPQQPLPNYYQPQQQMQQPSLYPPPTKRPGKGAAVAALVCSACAVGLFILGLILAAVRLSGGSGFSIIVSFLLSIVVLVLLIIVVARH
jgi:hypothetical protein